MTLDPQQAVFEEPIGTYYLHFKALYINGYINGKPSSKILVDSGTAVNVMPMTTFRKIGKLAEELIKTNMTLRCYGSRSSEVSGVTMVEVTVGSKTLPTTFFVIEGKGSPSDHASRQVCSCCYCRFHAMGLEKLPCLSSIYWDGEMLEITDEGA